MGSEGREDNEDVDIEQDSNTWNPNKDNEAEHSNNEISSLKDKQYGTSSS